MKSLLANKKGEAEEMVMPPMFEIIAAVAIVGLIFLGAIYKIGNSTEYEKKFHATDIALLIDSVYAVRQDVNFAVNYPLPVQFGADIGEKKVNVYDDKKEEGEVFWFNEDKAYDKIQGDFSTGRKKKEIRFFRNGNTIGVTEPDRSFSPAMPYCEDVKIKGEIHEFINKNIQQLGEKATELTSGDITVKARLKEGKPKVIIYTNRNPESSQIACRIAQKLFGKLEFEGYATIPLNPKMLADEDERKQTAESSGLALFVELTLPEPENLKIILGNAITNAVGESVE